MEGAVGRRTRRHVRRTLGETLDGDALPERKWAITAPRDGLKDGKQRIDPDSRWMRK